jgi:hypothetical protein
MFNDIGSTVTVEVDSERFHNNFEVGFWAHPLRYRGFSFGIVFMQRNVREQKTVKMQLAMHVLANLQPSI